MTPTPERGEDRSQAWSRISRTTALSRTGRRFNFTARATAVTYSSAALRAVSVSAC
jgi:hypothetical protein